ncbi:MAG: hypothetical protein IJD58_02430 [Lachnospiraceae bacterium]|nr:hypothetical protein [Lachnospiraceae bacterium]
MKKLVVFFPGVGYGFKHPLFYYADLLYETKGYERKYMSYQDICMDKKLTLEEKKVKVREYVFKQARGIDFKEYEEVVFLSKSIGTAEAGALAEKVGIKVTQIFLTPIESAIPYIKGASNVVIGTRDEAYSVCKEHCEKYNINALYIEDGDHSLEVKGELDKNIDILKQVMQFVDEKSAFVEIK